MGPLGRDAATSAARFNVAAALDCDAAAAMITRTDHEGPGKRYGGHGHSGAATPRFRAC